MKITFQELMVMIILGMPSQRLSGLERLTAHPAHIVLPELKVLGLHMLGDGALVVLGVATVRADPGLVLLVHVLDDDGVPSCLYLYNGQTYQLFRSLLWKF